MEARGNWRATVAGLIAAAVLLGLPTLFVTQTKIGRKLSRYERPVVKPPAQVTKPARSIGPAPTLRRGPSVKVRGKKMPTYITVDPQPGDASCAGTYVENGSLNGYPRYVKDLGGPDERWLIWATIRNGYSYTGWWLTTDPDIGTTENPYANGQGEGSTPDQGPWVVITAPWSDPPGTEPAPTLSEASANWWGPGEWLEAPYFGPYSAIRPCFAVLAGETYALAAVTPSVPPNHFGFILWRKSDQLFGWSGQEATLWDDCDQWQTGHLLDDGDGEHVWLNTGVYTTDDPAFTGFTCRKFAVDPGVSCEQVSSVDVPLPSDNISTFLPVGFGAVWFVMIDGEDVKLCEYQAGDSDYTVLATYASGTDLPAGFSPVEFVAYGGRHDHALLRYVTTDTVYWSRRCSNISDQHRLAMYEVDAEACTPLDDEILISTNMGNPQPGDNLTQTWATIGENLWGDMGRMHYSLTSIRWRPGVFNLETANPFLAQVPDSVERPWYVYEEEI